MEDDLWLKTTYDGRRLMMEDELWWKTTYDGRLFIIQGVYYQLIIMINNYYILIVNSSENCFIILVLIVYGYLYCTKCSFLPISKLSQLEFSCIQFRKNCLILFAVLSEKTHTASPDITFDTQYLARGDLVLACLALQRQTVAENARPWSTEGWARIPVHPSVASA